MVFYLIFKKIYYKIRDEINKGNQKHIVEDGLKTGITKKSFNYLNEDYAKGNIYYKDNNSNIVIIDIHGGAWIAGDKDTNDSFCYCLAQEGFIVYSLSYRNVDTCILKDQIFDIFNFINKIKEDIKNKLIFLTGDSAGGQLSLLTYIINNSNLLNILNLNRLDINISGLILNHSVCDIEEAANLEDSKLLSKYVAIPGMKRLLYGKKYKNDLFCKLTINPTKYIFKDTKLPPILLISSKGDKEYYKQTLTLFDYLKSLDKEVYLYFEEDENAEHVYNVTNPNSKLGDKCNKEIVKFIKNVVNNQ